MRRDSRHRGSEIRHVDFGPRKIHVHYTNGTSGNFDYREIHAGSDDPVIEALYKRMQAFKVRDRAPSYTPPRRSIFDF